MPYLVCPLCNSRLARNGNSLVCVHTHTFDIARDGYVNLLLTSQRSLRLRGDSRQMLRARRAFLQRGHFAPISDAINARVAGYLGASNQQEQATTPAGILDVGCGEGYYLDRLRQQLSEQVHRPLICHGVDIAKDAARLAARRCTELHIAVADVTARLPYADRSLQVLLDVFAPRNPREFARILVRGGLLVVAIPTPQHLQEVRALVPLLGIEEEKQRRVMRRLEDAFAFLGASTVAYDLALGADELIDLVQMTPSARHLTPHALDRVIHWRTAFHTHVSVGILCFERV